MGLPLDGLLNMKNMTNMTNMSNLTKQAIGNFGNKLDVASFEKMDGLEDFISSSDNPTLLKGVVTKIQQGDNIVETDFAGLSGQDMEFANDLKAIKGTTGPKDVADNFSELMGKYINSVDQKHKVAENAVETFATGGNIDVHSVMIASEQANLSMQLTMQLRNKILQAYQEINNVRV